MANVLRYLDRDNQYYPTPMALIKDILSEIDREYFYDREEINFLDCCAGDGAICREVKTFFKSDRGLNSNKEIDLKIDCLEIEKVLRDSLKGQGFNIIGEDFETFESMPFYDLIVINPPFSKGAKFLLKAYDLLNANGKLICILNAETINNPCNKERELLKHLIDRVGEVKFMNKPFSNSEYKTDVEIAVVYLDKPNYENEFDVFGGIKKEVLTEEEKISEELKEKTTAGDSDIMTFDKVENSIGIYRNCVNQIFKGIDTIQGIKTGLSYLNKEAEEFNIQPEEFIKVILENDQEDAKEETTKMIRKMVWSYVIKFCDMEQYLFSKHKEDFYNKLDKGSATLPFTKDNILQFLKNIFHNREEYLRKGIIDLFEEITSRHNGNTHHQEGWKTNKNWKINKKIIVNWGVFSYERYNPRSYGGTGRAHGQFSMGYSDGAGWLNDLDKIVRRIEPSGIDGYTIKGILENHFSNMGNVYIGDKFKNEVETHYFHLKFYKKGTLHITFKDEKLLKELNFMGAKLRTDLGYDDYGKGDIKEEEFNQDLKDI